MASAFLLVLVSSCNKYNKVTKSKDYEYKLKMADEYFSKGKYKIAQELYEELFPVFTSVFTAKTAYFFGFCLIQTISRPTEYFPQRLK